MAQQDTHPNHDTIQGLREVADWLEQHPELPKAWYGSLRWDYHGDTDLGARTLLEQVAAALGDRASETARYSDVEIRGEFPGRVQVCASASRSLLTREQAPPPYQPILPVASAQVAS